MADCTRTAGLGVPVEDAGWNSCRSGEGRVWVTWTAILGSWEVAPDSVLSLGTAIVAAKFVGCESIGGVGCDETSVAVVASRWAGSVQAGFDRGVNASPGFELMAGVTTAGTWRTRGAN